MRRLRSAKSRVRSPKFVRRPRNRLPPRKRGSSADPVWVPAFAGKVGVCVDIQVRAGRSGATAGRTRNPVSLPHDSGSRVRACGLPRDGLRKIWGIPQSAFPENRAEPLKKCGALRSATFENSGKGRRRRASPLDDSGIRKSRPFRGAPFPENRAARREKSGPRRLATFDFSGKRGAPPRYRRPLPRSLSRFRRA